MQQLWLRNLNGKFGQKFWQCFFNFTKHILVWKNEGEERSYFLATLTQLRTRTNKNNQKKQILLKVFLPFIFSSCNKQSYLLHGLRKSNPCRFLFDRLKLLVLNVGQKNALRKICFEISAFLAASWPTGTKFIPNSKQLSPVVLKTFINSVFSQLFTNPIH